VEDVGRVGEDVLVHFQLRQVRGKGSGEDLTVANPKKSNLNLDLSSNEKGREVGGHSETFYVRVDCSSLYQSSFCGEGCEMNTQDLGSGVELDAFEEGHVEEESLATPPDAKVGFTLVSGAFHHVFMMTWTTKKSKRSVVMKTPGQSSIKLSLKKTNDTGQESHFRGFLGEDEQHLDEDNSASKSSQKRRKRKGARRTRTCSCHTARGDCVQILS